MIFLRFDQISFLSVTKAFPAAEKINSFNHICFSLSVFSIKDIDPPIKGKGKMLDISVIFKYGAVKIHIQSLILTGSARYRKLEPSSLMLAPSIIMLI